MKFRFVFILVITTVLLTACTLAADITPPPDYVSPTPGPTLGPLFPVSAPDIQNGKAIYAEKCVGCHGETGMGDGPDSKNLPVSVAALGLPETARKATPATWYTTVTQGNLQRFMPPFTSLDEQQRWDVISYALTLHTTGDEIAKGKTIFETSCADCADKFKNQEMMAGLSADELVNIIKKGKGDIAAFGGSLSDADAYAVADYLRTLTFLTEQPTPTLAPASETPVSSGTGTPSAELTPAEGTPQAEVTAEATVAAGFGTVTGTIDNQSGQPFPADMKVTLHVYDHSDQTSGPQEILTLDSTVEANGAYQFENVEIPENRLFVAEVQPNGISYQSGFVAAQAGATEVSIPAIVIHASTDDYTALVVDNVRVHINYTSAESIQVFIVYSMHNTGDKTIVVTLENNNQNIPFIKAPANSQGLGFQATQDSAPFIGTQGGNGFAMPPSDQTYGLVAFADLPVSGKLEFSQEFVLAVKAVDISMPEGMTASGDTLANTGLTSLQDQNGQTVNFQTYSTGSLNAGDTLKFTVSGKPKAASTTANLLQNKTLLIGVGALGLALILAGVWFYLRDRKQVDEEEEENAEFEDSESILDAIIALDDLHRGGKLSDEAYHKRRDELKAKLKE